MTGGGRERSQWGLQFLSLDNRVDDKHLVGAEHEILRLSMRYIMLGHNIMSPDLDMLRL